MNEYQPAFLQHQFSSDRHSTANLTTSHGLKRKACDSVGFNVLYKALEYLKARKMEGKSATCSELCNKLNVDATTLIQNLQGNPKITMDDSVSDYIFTYKPKYDVNSYDELRDLLAKSPDGIRESDLSDCYKGVKEDIKKLHEGKGIFKIMNTENKDFVLYPNQVELSVHVHPQFQEIWKKIKVSDDLQDQMVKLNLKPKVEKDKVTQGFKHTSKERSKRTPKQNSKRIVNTHVKEFKIDLTRSYAMTGPQANPTPPKNK